MGTGGCGCHGTGKSRCLTGGCQGTGNSRCLTGGCHGTGHSRCLTGGWRGNLALLEPALHKRIRHAVQRGHSPAAVRGVKQVFPERARHVLVMAVRPPKLAQGAIQRRHHAIAPRLNDQVGGVAAGNVDRAGLANLQDAVQPEDLGRAALTRVHLERREQTCTAHKGRVKDGSGRRSCDCGAF